MLWNLVYEFFVKYIFGGIYNDITYYTAFSQSQNMSEVNVSVLGQSILISNYFCFLATLISMVVIVLICCALIKKIYNMCAHIIG